MKKYEVVEYEMKDYNDFKNNLTKEECINLLEYIKRGYIPDYNYTMKEDDFERYTYHMAMSQAIQILELMTDAEWEEQRTHCR